MLPRLVRAVLRGFALFIGAFSAANGLVLVAAGRAEDLWWIDLSGIPALLAVALTGVGAVLLVWYGLRAPRTRRRRWATAAACSLLAAVAVSNTATFYLGARAAKFEPAVGVPFSALIAVALGAVTWSVLSEPPDTASARFVWVAGWAVAAALAFPVLHVLSFGTTDYRAPADAAVVLGARVYADGRLSQSLEDRVATAAELYSKGLVNAVVMSGGVGASGVDEAEAMKVRAVQLGVPARAVLLDSRGVDTDATVANTSRILRRRGLRRVLVVSQFYHLPRVKMAYRAAGLEVRTVPARRSRPIAKTPLFVLREIPGFWVYWARAAWRDVAAG